MRRDIHEATAALGTISVMQSAPEVQDLLRFLVGTLGAKACADIGSFTGGSAMAMAEAGARVFAFERNPEWATMAQTYWERAGVGDRIHLRVGVALEHMQCMPDDALDLVFIDADKGNYHQYYAALLPRVRPGGVLVFDDTDWFGQADNPTSTDLDAQAMRAMNATLAADPRVETVRLSISNGVTLCRKLGGHHA